MRSPSSVAARLRRRSTSPASLVVLGFCAAIAVGTLLLSLPIARPGPAGTPLIEALFTATSAVCVNGLTVVDTATYWSGFGEAVIVALVQVGGFGIMTLATLLGLLVSRRLGLRSRLTATAESKSLGTGDVRRILFGVARTSLLLEAAGAVVLTARFATAYDEPFGRALWLGVFHAVSAFNNAGFALFSDSLSGFTGDPWICVPALLLVLLGSLGFPVLFELRRAWRTPQRWTLHTKIVMAMTALLVPLGTALYLVLEWSNPRTFGPLGVPTKLLAGLFQGVMPRSGGFNTVDTASLDEATLLGVDVLMFIGGGSGGTAGGIKVTTFAVLLFVIVTEVRGDESVTAFGRRIPRSAQRQALSVALLAVAVVVGSTAALLVLTPFSLDRVLFEVTSAASTTGLSTGLAAEAGTPAQALLTLLMLLGRLGPITLASALALRSRPKLYDVPYERPIIG